ncbi:MAG TPA: hypothetical protein VFC53_03595 [Dehalococcoidia bacterium]|nr:hypothetical protein [Dehalococcoidia bacterium]
MTFDRGLTPDRETLRLALGRPLFTADGARLGEVADVHGSYLKVSTAWRRDFWLSGEYLDSTSEDGATLTFDKSHLDEHKLSEPGLEPEDDPFRRIAAESVVPPDEQLRQRELVERELAEQRQRLPHVHEDGPDSPPSTRGGTVGEPVEEELERTAEEVERLASERDRATPRFGGRVGAVEDLGGERQSVTGSGRPPAGRAMGVPVPPPHPRPEPGEASAHPSYVGDDEPPRTGGQADSIAAEVERERDARESGEPLSGRLSGGEPGGVFAPDVYVPPAGGQPGPPLSTDMEPGTAAETSIGATQPATSWTADESRGVRGMESGAGGAAGTTDAMRHATIPRAAREPAGEDGGSPLARAPGLVPDDREEFAGAAAPRMGALPVVAGVALAASAFLLWRRARSRRRSWRDRAQDAAHDAREQLEALR